MSFCDLRMTIVCSSVCCLSKISLNNIFGGPLLNLLKDFHFMLNSGCHGNQTENFKKIFLSKMLENNLVQIFLEGPSTKIAKIKFDLLKNMATRGRRQFSPYINRENIKNLLVKNYWANLKRIWYKWSTKIVQIYLIF